MQTTKEDGERDPVLYPQGVQSYAENLDIH